MKSQYRIINVEITMDTQVIYINNMYVLSCMIFDDYMNRRVPIIQLDLACEVDIIDTIVNYPSNPKIKIEIYEDILSSDNDALIETKLYMRGVFDAIAINEKTEYKLLEGLPALPPGDNLDKFASYQVYLIKMEDLDYFNVNNSFVFKNVSKPDILKAFFVSRDIPPKIIIASPPDGNFIENASIPNGDLIANITHLNNHYGLYPSTPLIYKDMFNMYCMCTYNPNIIMPNSPEEYNVEFVIPDDRDINKIKIGYVIDDVERIVKYQINHQPILKDMSYNINNITFSTVMSVDQKGDVNKVNVGESGNKLKYIYQTNTLNTEKIINDEHFKSKTVEITSVGLALRYLKPYKNCKIKFSEAIQSAYGLVSNDFMISSMITYFSRDGEVFDANTSMLLRNKSSG